MRKVYVVLMDYDGEAEPAVYGNPEDAIMKGVHFILPSAERDAEREGKPKPTKLDVKKMGFEQLTEPMRSSPKPWIWYCQIYEDGPHCRVVEVPHE